MATFPHSAGNRRAGTAPAVVLTRSAARVQYGGPRCGPRRPGERRRLVRLPQGAGAEWGYYTDRYTGLLLLTHRYHDPAAGRFRNPIGYAGWVNL